MEDIKYKIEKVKKLIKDTKEEREKRIINSNIKELLVNKSNYYYKYKFNKYFIEYLEKEMDNKTLLKLVKKTKLKSGNNPFGHKKWVWEIFPKKEWEEFSKLLTIAEKYHDPYQLYKQQCELCHYTDCYKKLITEKTCIECLSINPIESIYCNQCGEKL